MTVEVSSPVTGVLDSVEVNRGDFVTQGQILARLNSGVEQATVDLSKVRAKSNVNIEAERVQVELHKRRLARIDELHRKNMASALEQDEAKTAVVAAEYAVKQAQERRRIANLEYKRAIEFLSLRTVKSPINGMVVQRHKSPGEYIEEQPIVTVVQFDPINIEVIAPLSRFGTIKPGMRANVTLEEPVGGQYTAVVKIVDSVIDAASATFGIRLEISNPDHKIPAGLRCDISFLAQ